MVPQPKPILSTSSSPESSNLPSSDSHPSVYSLQSHYTETGEGTEVSDGDSPSVENLSNEEEKGNSSVSGKKAPEIFVDEGEDEDDTGTLQDDHGAKPSYPPPKRPLTPYQLARIAGTFGIVVPNLPFHRQLQCPQPLAKSRYHHQHLKQKDNLHCGHLIRNSAIRHFYYRSYHL